MNFKEKMKILMWALFALGVSLTFIGILKKDWRLIITAIMTLFLGGRVHTDIRLMRINEKMETKIKQRVKKGG